MGTFENVKKICKTWRNFEKTSGNPYKNTERCKAETQENAAFLTVLDNTLCCIYSL